MCKAHNKHRQDSPPLGAPGVTSEEERKVFFCRYPHPTNRIRCAITDYGKVKIAL